MMIRGMSGALAGAGFMIFIMAKIIPFLSLFFFDWMGVAMMLMGVFMLLFMFGPSETGLLYDNIPSGTAVVPFIRRDGIIRPLLFKRIFSGESFLENSRVGLIEDIGKGTVFLWGKKKIRFGLENLNYTPDPHHWPLTKQLYEMGFDDNEDLWNVLHIPDMDPVKDKTLKAFYLERMAVIYWNMTHEEYRAGKRLVHEFEKKPFKRISFKKKSKIMTRLEKPVEKRITTDDEERLMKLIKEK
jgi:hypothetical protein